MIKKFKAIIEVELEIHEYDFNEPERIENMEEYDYFVGLCRNSTASFVKIQEI
ncbi:hypothetical protein P4V41_08020 [Fictibacillus nanhaiensis]|uniref:hypothetical protein n=1 Tax=Fictibacillus nanhaiensis TaxID=742169 RepID=UPI002E1DA572|nr:hypothetical protein [Fictibacillus nanhaiensis]